MLGSLPLALHPALTALLSFLDTCLFVQKAITGTTKGFFSLYIVLVLDFVALSLYDLQGLRTEFCVSYVLILFFQ